MSEPCEQELASAYKAPEDLVFPSSTSGKPQQFEQPRLEAGVKVVSALCGHSSISIKLDTCAHLLPEPTQGIGDALSGSMSGSAGSRVEAGGSDQEDKES